VVTEHLREDAELYPLGILDDDATRNVERHIALCSACAERVAQAQAVAASLAAALPLATPSPALLRRVRESARLQPSAKFRAGFFPFALARSHWHFSASGGRR
jgi:anti-sigma factor RsiW